MPSWSDVAIAAPELTQAAQQLFDSHRHKTLATLRRDGAPRISGIEASFREGKLLLGMMPHSRKAADLRRDPRLALHSGSADPNDDDPSDWAGDAKLAGRAIEVRDPDLLAAIGAPDSPDGSPDLFEVDVTELVVTKVGDPADHLVIDTWHPGAGVVRLTRS